MKRAEGLNAYLEYLKVKQQTTRVSPLRKELIAAQERIRVLESSNAHFFAVGKSVETPCKTCGLPYSDKIHRDSSWSTHA